MCCLQRTNIYVICEISFCLGPDSACNAVDRNSFKESGLVEHSKFQMLHLLLAPKYFFPWCRTFLGHKYADPKFAAVKNQHQQLTAI